MKKCRTFLVTDAMDWYGCTKFDEAQGLYDDNGGAPDGDMLPVEPLSLREAQKMMFDPNDWAALGQEVDAMYFNSSRELLEFAHGEDVDLASLDQDEIETQAWSIAQNLGRYATRYSASDIIIVANDLPVAW